MANTTHYAGGKTIHPGLLGRCRCGGKPRPGGAGNCITVEPDSPIEKPDLAIYSQAEQLDIGNPPTWDSPDIVTNDWGPFRLQDTAQVTIRNLSATVPATNTLVHYFVSPFGIGTARELKLTRAVSVPAASEIELEFPLDPQTLGGDPRVGVHILIEHPHDPKAINNEGSQVHDGAFTTESGRNFTLQIPVQNNSNFTRQIELSLMPTELVASVSPASLTLAPFQQVNATLSVEVPGFLSGTPADFLTRAATVVARLAGGELLGGATRLVRIDD